MGKLLPTETNIPVNRDHGSELESKGDERVVSYGRRRWLLSQSPRTRALERRCIASYLSILERKKAVKRGRGAAGAILSHEESVVRSWL